MAICLLETSNSSIDCLLSWMADALYRVVNRNFGIKAHAALHAAAPSDLAVDAQLTAFKQYTYGVAWQPIALKQCARG